MAVTPYGPTPHHHLFDPARGSFDPVRREPPADVFRPGKTRQDRMPVALRPRVVEHQARLDAMKAAA